jgi:hypothetical protein
MPYTPLRSTADVAAHLRVGESREDDYLDFKAAIPYPGKSDLEDRRECALDLGQFANAMGGVLVIGATDESTLLTGFESVPDPGKLIAWINDVTSGQLRPVPVFDCQEIVTESRARIVTVNVTPHPTVVARYRDTRYEFVVRTGPRTRHLEMDELEARMQGHERVMRFRLDQIPPDAQVGLDARLHQLSHNDWRVVGVTEDIVCLSKDGEQVTAPLAYVDAVYRPDEPDAEWVIRLSCYITPNQRMGGLFLAKEVPHGYVASSFNARWY